MPRTTPGVPAGFNRQATQQTGGSNAGGRGTIGTPQRPVTKQNNVFGSRQAQAAARSSGTGSPTQQPGVRAPRVKSGGDHLNRGVIRGAKQGSAPARPAGDINYGQRPARNGVVKTKEEDGVESTYEEQVFTVDQQVVPGIIRGHKSPPKSNPGHSGRPAFDDDDDW